MVLAEIHDELCNELSTMENVLNEPITRLVTPIDSLCNMETERIGPCESVLREGNTNIMEVKTKLDHNLSREGSPIRNSTQWSEIVNFLDNEEYTTGYFLDEETSTTQTPVISPELDILDDIDSSTASSRGSAISEKDDTESTLAMIEIHETPVRGMSG